MSDTSAAAPAQTILIVDDTEINLSIMAHLLKDHYRTRQACSGEMALQITSSETPPDLILLDLNMPGIGGIETCRRLKSDPRTAKIPVIFLTVSSDTEDEQTGLDAGAVDYIIKPVSPPIVLTRIKTHLRLKAAADFLEDNNAFLKAEVEYRMLEVQAIQDATIIAMASLAETRDNETGNHIHRTQHYIRLISDKLSFVPKFRDFLSPETKDLLFKSAPLHDIGKVGIPDRILQKPGKLTKEEFEIMKTHTTLDRDAIAAAETRLKIPSNFLRFAHDIAFYHHERWDGTGYPEKLAGDAIPIAARLMAIADVYDALISRRVYKPPYSHDKAVEMIREERGRHFDPDVVDAFLQITEEFHSVARHFCEAGEILDF